MLVLKGGKVSLEFYIQRKRIEIIYKAQAPYYALMKLGKLI
jgi:hypothetical protein